MPMPVRVRLSRRKGWRKPHGAIVVARPSRWGNPFPVRPVDGGWAVHHDGELLARYDDRATAHADSVERYRRWAPEHVDAAALRGADLACWCALDEACHADVLLALANGDPRELRPR